MENGWAWLVFGPKRHEMARNPPKSGVSGFILPTALTRLMRKLRGLGLDTVILKEGLPQRELVEQAEREDRSQISYRNEPK